MATRQNGDHHAALRRERRFARQIGPETQQPPVCSGILRRMAALSTGEAGSEVVLAGEQIDLFVESLVSAPLRDDRATMEFPFSPSRSAPC
jgi:hypothetical protein